MQSSLTAKNKPASMPGLSRQLKISLLLGAEFYGAGDGNRTRTISLEG